MWIAVAGLVLVASRPAQAQYLCADAPPAHGQSSGRQLPAQRVCFEYAPGTALAGTSEAMRSSDFRFHFGRGPAVGTSGAGAGPGAWLGVGFESAGHSLGLPMLTSEPGPSGPASLAYDSRPTPTAALGGVTLVSLSEGRGLNVSLPLAASSTRLTQIQNDRADSQVAVQVGTFAFATVAGTRDAAGLVGVPSLEVSSASASGLQPMMPTFATRNPQVLNPEPPPVVPEPSTLIFASAALLGLPGLNWLVRRAHRQTASPVQA